MSQNLLIASILIVMAALGGFVMYILMNLKKRSTMTQKELKEEEEDEEEATQKNKDPAVLGSPWSPGIEAKSDEDTEAEGKRMDEAGTGKDEKGEVEADGSAAEGDDQEKRLSTIFVTA